MLVVYGSRKRYILDEKGDRITLIIRRMKCTKCSRIHHELPDCITPYRHYSTAVIELLLSHSADQPTDFPGEDSTMFRLCSWFSLLRIYFEGLLNALKLQWKDDLAIQNKLNTLLPLLPENLESGWLKKLVRYAVNTGQWPTDPLCIVCPGAN